jgi:hypothetical protein
MTRQVASGIVAEAHRLQNATQLPFAEALLGAAGSHYRASRALRWLLRGWL